MRKPAHDEVLITFIGRLPLLLPGTHEPPPGDDAEFDLRQVHLHHHAFFSCLSISHLCDTIARSADLEEDLALNVARSGSNHQLRVLEVPRGTSSEVRLMLLALRVSKIGSLIRVKSKT